MPRHARAFEPGSLESLITRFANGEHRPTNRDERRREWAEPTSPGRSLGSSERRRCEMRHVKIPADWSGEEALAVVSFLDSVIRAVWREHGRKITEELYPGECELRCDPHCTYVFDQLDEAPPL
jgi:hypothetical protein